MKKFRATLHVSLRKEAGARICADKMRGDRSRERSTKALFVQCGGDEVDDVEHVAVAQSS